MLQKLFTECQSAARMPPHSICSLNCTYCRRTANDRLSYARKFADCLLNRDLSQLRTLSDDKRAHALKGLSALAKFLGVYDTFKRLRRNYGLKWGGRSSDDFIIARLTKVVGGSEVYEWIREVKAEIPDYAAIGLNDQLLLIILNNGFTFARASMIYSSFVNTIQ